MPIAPRIRRFLLVFITATLTLSAQETLKSLTILHSNDLHAHLTPDDKDLGGFARLATAVRQQKANCRECLYLNAGDMVQGTPVSTLFHGIPIYEIANLLGLDAGTLGNHEFDYGWRRVQEFSRIAKFPIVSANIVDANGKSITGKPYVIKNVNGIRVGIIGVVLGDLVGNFVTAPQVGMFKVLPVVETVRKYAHELRDQTDILIVLGHIHDQEEVEEILKQVPEVSVVVAGHNHTEYPKMLSVDGRVAVLVQSYGVELGRLDLKLVPAEKKVRSAEWTKIFIDKQFTPDPTVARLVSTWESKVTKLVDLPIGESKTRRLRTDAELRRTIEQAMADATHADFAWINPGNIRDTLPEGTVLARNIWNILPFDNYIVTGKFKGSQLPAKITERYPVEPNREYTVATTDFTMMNQASSDQLGVSGLAFPNTGPLQRDAVIDWIKKKKVIP